MPFENFPYTNFHDLNLNYLLQALKTLEDKVDTYLEYSTIKYADPIQWNITTQYEENTVVVTDNGSAYLSTQPVPSGINITDTSYWTPIGNFSELWSDLKQAICSLDLGNSTTATSAITDGELFFMADTLYKALQNITQGSVITEGANAEKVTVEELLNNQRAEVETELEELRELIESVDDSNPVNIVARGAKDDGSEDVSALINQITETHDIYIPAGRFLITSPIRPKHSIIGAGAVRVSSGITELVASFTSTTQGVIEIDADNDTEESILLKGFCIDCTNFNGYGINYQPSRRILTEIDSVTVHQNKNTAFNIAPTYNFSRPVYMHNISIDSGGGNGIYFSSNAGDCVATDLEIMYAPTAIKADGWLLRLANTHLYAGVRHADTQAALDEAWTTSRGVDASGIVIAENVYIDSFFVNWIQRALFSNIGNMVSWYDTWMQDASSSDGRMVQTVGSANVHINNLITTFCDHVSAIFAGNVTVNNTSYQGGGSYENWVSNGCRPLVMSPQAPISKPNNDATTNAYVCVAVAWVASNNAGKAEYTIFGGTNELKHLTIATGTTNSVTITATNLNGYRSLYYKSLGSGLLAIYMNNLTKDYVYGATPIYAVDSCALVDIYDMANVTTPYQTDTTDLTAITYGTAVTVQVR